MNGEIPFGAYQCQHCYLTFGMWRGKPDYDNAPTCCGGDVCTPYRIIPEAHKEPPQAKEMKNE